MAGENVNSPLPTALHQSSGLVPSASLSAPSASQQQPLLQMPAASPSSLPPGASPVPPASGNSAQMPAGSGVGGVAGQGHQQFAGPQQTSQGLQQSSNQALGNATAQSSSVQGQSINLQSLQQQPNSAGQLHAVNLTQGQAFGQNQQSLARNVPLNQMSYQQNQQQKQGSGQRIQHGQYAQNQLNSGTLQTQDHSQQTASAAMVQSPPGSHSISRTSSSQRLVQFSQATSMPGARAATLGSQFGPGSLSAVPTVGGTALQQQQQQQLLMAHRAAQGQGAPQQRPLQSPQAAQQNQQHPSMQSGQTGTQSIHQQATPSGLMGSNSSRPLYGNQYSQHVQQWPQMGNLQRPGQAAAHPSMHPVQGSMALTNQLSSQPMQGRQSKGQVQASQFPASVPSPIGSPLVRPSGPHSQQQWVSQTQARISQQQQPAQQHQQQQQPQTPQQPQSLTSPQKLQAQQLQRVPAVSSTGSGLQPSSSPAQGVLPNQQQQQSWMQKQLHQQSSAYQLHHQQAAQQKQPQTHLSQQLQTQQTQMSQQTQQAAQLQQPQQQQGRVQTSAAQRPVTPTGVQPTTPASTNLGGAMSQPSESGNRILGKRSIQELVAQVDPNERLDPEVEDILLEIADDFIESVTTFACKLAKHRKSNVLEAKDVLLHLNRNWDINIPGFGGEEYHAYKRLSVSETHKQRLALVKKSIAIQPTGQDAVVGKALGGQPANASTGSQAPMIV